MDKQTQETVDKLVVLINRIIAGESLSISDMWSIKSMLSITKDVQARNMLLAHCASLMVQHVPDFIARLIAAHSHNKGA